LSANIKSIFITGGSTGIGFELALIYLREGHRVAVCGRDKNKIDEKYFKEFPSFHFYEVDVVDRKALREAVLDFEKGADLDIMVANAGISVGNKSSLPDLDRGRRVLDVNVVGFYNTFEIGSEMFLKKQVSRKGHLVAIASVAGFVGLPGAAAYSASKAYVLKYCESLVLDLPRHGINVTCINPGFVDTPLTRKNNHHMPWLMPANKAAKKIKRAIDYKKAVYTFPWQMNLLMSIMYHIPRAIYRFFIRYFVKDRFSGQEKV